MDGPPRILVALGWLGAWVRLPSGVFPTGHDGLVPPGEYLRVVSWVSGPGERALGEPGMIGLSSGWSRRVH